MKTFKKLALAVAVSSGLVMTGCGGGGGGGSPAPEDDTTNNGSVVVGSAVKGVMKNAIVTVYELNSSGDRLTAPVGSSTTDDKGEYRVELGSNYGGGVIEIEVTVSSATRMVCDASACGTKGENITLPTDFKLNAIGKASEAGSSVSVPVTAWSTMAAKRAKVLIGSGKSVSDAAKQAKSEVSQVAGFDIENTAARDVNNLADAGPAEAQAAVMNAVVAELIFSGGDTANISANLEKFSSALDDGDVGNEGDSVTPSQLSKATQTIVASTPNLDTDAKDLLNNQTAQYDSSETFKPPYDESLAVDEGSPQAEKIKAFQTFAAQARTWAQSIEDLDSDALGAAIQVDTDTIGAALGDGSLNALQMSLDIIGQSLELVITDSAGVQAALENGTSITTNIVNDGVEIGNASLSFTDDNGLVVNLVGSITGQAGTTNLPFAFELQTGLPIASLDLQNGVVTNLLSSTTMTLTGLVSDGAGFDLARLNGVEATVNLSSEVNAEDATGVSGEQISAQFQNAALSGDVELFAVTGESFSGTAEARVVRLISNQRISLNDTPLSIERLRLSGTFDSGDGTTFTTSATLNINNASSFDTVSWLDYSEASRDVDEPIDVRVLGAFTPDFPADAIQPSVNLRVWGAPHSNRESSLWASAYLADGAEKSYYLNLDAITISDVSEAAKTAVIDALPTELTFTYSDPVDFTEQTVSLSVLSLLESGAASFSGDFDDPEFRRIHVTVYPDSSLLPDGVTDAYVTSGLPDANVDSGYVYNFGGAQEEFNLSFGSDAIVASVKTAVSDAAAMPQDAVFVSVSADERGQWGSASFTRPAELAYYETCLADPVNQLPNLGYTWFDPDYGDGGQACADATLTYLHESEESLSADALATADGIVNQALEARYGAIAQDLTVFGYQLGTYNGDGYMSAEVEFPNLESADNFVDASFTVSSSVVMPELPQATVTATATRNSFTGGKVLANVKWEDGQYSLQVSSDDLDQPSSVTARFFNPQGYELVVNVSLDEFGDVTDIGGDALLNGEDIGDVELRNGAPVITYPNGEETIFETLF